MIEEKISYTFLISNSCNCQVYNEETDIYTEAEDCYGDCWYQQIEDFKMITETLFDNNETFWWRVENLKLWDGDHSGFIYARDHETLLRGMTVVGDWTMRGNIFDDRIEYSLSHHDAPMGSKTVLTIVSEEQRENWLL